MTTAGSDNFAILFSGELCAGANRENSLEKLSQLTNIDQAELLDALFSVKPVIVNRVADAALAETYRAAFAACGLRVWVEPCDESHDDIINAELVFGHYAPIARAQSAPNYIVDTDELEESAAPREDPAHAPAEDAVTATPFTVVFHGELEPGVDKSEAIENIRHLTKASRGRVVEELFSVVPVIIKRSANRATAEEYFEAFSRAGLKLELHSDPVEAAIWENSLALRYDAPAPLPAKRTPRFTYYLLGIAGLAVIAWGLIFVSQEGFFRQSGQNIVEVQLQVSQPAPVVEEPAALPAPPTSSAVTPKTPDRQTPAPKPAATPRQPKIKSIAELGAAEQSYYMELLSWFAHPQHQQYDSETRKLNLEGEIELHLTIARDGTLKQVNVASSSSAELTAVTTATAQRASPYPPVPDAIAGSEYSFRLPLKYTLGDSL